MNAKQQKLPPKDVRLAVKFIVKNISEALKSKKNVELRGFGSFSVRLRAASLCHNPRTGELVQVGARHLPHFKPANKLRTRVFNAKRS